MQKWPGSKRAKRPRLFWRCDALEAWILQTLPGLTERSTARWSHVIPISSLVILRICDACMWSQRQPSSAVCVLSWVLLFACLHALGVASVCNSVTSVAVVVKETCRCAAVSDRPSCAPCWLNKNMYSNISAVSFCFGRTEPEKNVEMIQISLFLRVCVQKACKNSAFIYIGTYLHCNYVPYGCAMLPF